MSTTSVEGHRNQPDIRARNEKGETALHVAAAAGDVAAVRDLVERGASPNDVQIMCGQAINITPVRAAAAGGHLAVVKYLAEKGGILREEDGPFGAFSVLGAASASGNTDLVRFLVEEKRLPVNEPDADVLPLLMAIENARLSTVRCLLEFGADPTIATKIQPSPIEYAKDKLKASGGGAKDDLAEIVRLLSTAATGLRGRGTAAGGPTSTRNAQKKWWQVWR
jgi:ankyrin repeat protein